MTRAVRASRARPWRLVCARTQSGCGVTAEAAGGQRSRGRATLRVDSGPGGARALGLEETHCDWGAQHSNPHLIHPSASSPRREGAALCLGGWAPF